MDSEGDDEVHFTLNYEDSDQSDGLESALDKLLQKDKELEKIPSKQFTIALSDNLNSKSGKLPDLTEMVNASSVAPTLDNALSYNKACMKVLRQIHKQLKSLLENNRKKQKELVEYMTLRRKGGIGDDEDPTSSLKIKCVGMPYFKDKDGFLPPHTKEMKKKLVNNELLPEDYLASVGTWNKKEHETLEDAVIDYVRYSRIEKLSLKRKDMENNIKKTEEIESIDNEIEDIKNKPPLLLDINPNEVDWLMISSQVMMGKYSDCECEAKWTLELDPKINKSKWSSEELKKLEVVAKKCDCQDWDSIAQKLGTNRSGYNCCVQYHLRSNTKEGKWTAEEDKKLKELVQKYHFKNYVPWTKIAWHFDSRSSRQCRDRYSVIPENIKKGRFNPQEDFKLVVKLKECESNFQKVAKTFPNRSAKQIRYRYDYLVGKNMDPFSKEEQKLLIKLVREHSRDFNTICKHFENRTALQCRKAWEKLAKHLPVDSNAESEFELESDSLSEDYSYSLPPKDELDIKPVKVKRNGRKSVQPPEKSTVPELAKNVFNKKSKPYEALLKYLKTGHEFSYGPKPKLLKNQEQIDKSSSETSMIMSMLGVSCDFSSKLEAVQSVESTEFYDEDRIILQRLCEKEYGNTSLVHNKLIPPNYNTLVGLRSLLLWNNDVKDSDDLPETESVSNPIPQNDRLLFTDAKLLFKKRFQALFALPIICSLTNPETIPDLVVKPKAKKKASKSKKRAKDHSKKMVQAKQSLQKNLNDGSQCEMDVQFSEDGPTCSSFINENSISEENIPVPESRKRPIGRPKREVAKTPRTETRRSISTSTSTSIDF